MSKYYKFLTLLFLTAQLAWAADSPVVEEVKVIEKTFSVNSNANLLIDNKYGNVTMTTWDKNTVEIRVEIRVDGRNSDAVKERLNGISVDFNASASQVSAKTQIAQTRWNNKTNISIHYTVKLPKTNNINIKNQYGNLFLDELKGSSNIQLDYGNLSFGKLHNALNNFNLDYVTSAKIDFIKSANINADYSKIEITKGEVIQLSADYTDANLGEIKDLINDMDYGNLNVNKIEKVASTADYTNIKIGTLVHSIVSSGDYGGILIKKVNKGFDKIIINADYASLSLGIDATAGYSLTGNFAYGSLQAPSNLSFSKKIIKNTSSYYEGKVGNGGGKIEINMSYGSAKISN